MIARLLSHLPRRGILQGGLLVLGSTLVWHLSNFGFNSAAARILGPAEYGTLASVLAMLYLGSPLIVAIQTVASRVTTTLVESGEQDRLGGLLRHYGLRLAAAGTAVCLAVAALSGPIAGFLRVDSATLGVAIIGFAFLIAFLTHLQRGVLQGTKSFGRYSISTVVEAVVKLTAALVIMLLIADTVEGAVAAVVVGSLVGLAANHLLLRRLARRGPGRRRPEAVAFLRRYSIATVACLSMLALLLALDVMAAKRYLEDDAAGIYAAASLSGKIVFFFTSAVALFMFPFFSERQERGVSARRPLAKGLLVVSGASLAIVAVYLVVPEVVIRPLFGARYAEADHYVAWLGLAFGFYAIIYMTATYMLAQANPIGLIALAATLVVQMGGLYSFHSDAWDIIAVQLVAFASGALVLTALAAQTHPGGRPAFRPGLRQATGGGPSD